MALWSVEPVAPVLQWHLKPVNGAAKTVSLHCVAVPPLALATWPLRVQQPLPFPHGGRLHETASRALQGLPLWMLFVSGTLLRKAVAAVVSCPQEPVCARLQVSNSSLAKRCQRASSRPLMPL